MALVREGTIPSERLLLVGEVSANFLRIEGCRIVSVADICFTEYKFEYIKLILKFIILKSSSINWKHFVLRLETTV
jgi:hypothetical protein